MNENIEPRHLEIFNGLTRDAKAAVVTIGCDYPSMSVSYHPTPQDAANGFARRLGECFEGNPEHVREILMFVRHSTTGELLYHCYSGKMSCPTHYKGEAEIIVTEPVLWEITSPVVSS